MIHTSLVSSIVILLWRMIWFIPTSRILSPPAVPKYNMQSIYSVHPQVRLRSFWSQAVSAIKWSLQHLCNLFKQPTEKSGFFFKLLSLLIKDSTGPVVNVFTTVSSARQTDADQQAGPSLIKGAKYPARLEAIHLQLECYSSKIQGLFLRSSGLSLFSNEPWCDSLEMTKGNDSEAGIKGHREQPLMITQQAGLAHKLMLLVHMSRCGVMNHDVFKMDMEAKSVNSNSSWYSTFHSILLLFGHNFL